jgi:hypothetical protein
LLKILKFFKKPKKKNYSLDSLLRIYEELAKQELEANKRRNIQYIYVHEPREYYLDSKPQPPERKLQFYSGIEWM